MAAGTRQQFHSCRGVVPRPRPSAIRRRQATPNRLCRRITSLHCRSPSLLLTSFFAARWFVLVLVLVLVPTYRATPPPHVFRCIVVVSAVFRVPSHPNNERDPFA